MTDPFKDDVMPPFEPLRSKAVGSTGYQPVPSGIPNGQLKRPKGGTAVEPPANRMADALREIAADPRGRAIPDHAAAAWALARIAELEQEAAMLRGAMLAQDNREKAAGERCGVPYHEHGCDWPDAAADEIETLKKLLAGQAERIAAQAELLAKKAGTRV